ncbi:MAG: hypothetical protein ABI765_16305 [Gemmatimonadota bacterium]
MDRGQLQDLRRVVDALAGVRGRGVEGCALRSDHRQLKLELSEGVLLVVGIELDEQGRPRLMVDVTRPTAQATAQLEVPFGLGT